MFCVLMLFSIEWFGVKGIFLVVGVCEFRNTRAE